MAEQKQDIVTKELEKLKTSGANILMPSIHIAGMSEFHSAVIETVHLSANPDDGDVYPHDTDGKKFRPTKQALMKLSVCAGVIWSPTESKRVDNGADRNYIAYRAVGGIRKADGQPVFFSAEYDLDFEVMEEELRDLYEKKAARLRDKDSKGKAEYVEYCVKRDMLQKRKYRLRLCEAGAMNRVLRMLLGIKQAYTVAELAKPFVMARIVFKPDFTDKAVKQQFIDASIKAMTGIYGLAAATAVPDKFEPIDVTPCPTEKEKEEEPPQEPGDKTYTLGSQESQAVDFQDCDLASQASTLEKLAKRKGYDLPGYLVKAKATFVADLTPERRVEFFKYLLSLPGEDVPF
jgi:hypothetical protein